LSDFTITETQLDEEFRMAANVAWDVGGTVEFNCTHALTVVFGSLAGVALLTSSHHVMSMLLGKSLFVS